MEVSQVVLRCTLTHVEGQPRYVLVVEGMARMLNSVPKQTSVQLPPT